MAGYIPKSKVSILQTPGNKFVIASTNQPYQGSYMELSDGSYFAGNNPQNLGEELIIKKPLNDSFGVSRNNSKYRKLKRPIYNNLSKTTSVPVSKPQPTAKDYDRGYFTRYFCKRANSQFDYIEIDKKTYGALVSQDPKHDFNLYEIGNIKWALSDTPNHTVGQINKKNIKQKANIWPFLIILFGDSSEYKITILEKMSQSIRKAPTLTKHLKERITQEQKAARQKEIASVTQEDINKAIKDLESGKTPYIYNPGF